MLVTLAFAERARTEALREAGASHDELVTRFGLIFVVRRIKMDYVRPVRLDAEMVVETGPWLLKGASVDVEQRFTVAKASRRASFSVGLACIRTSDGRPARIPQRWRDALGGAGGEST